MRVLSLSLAVLLSGPVSASPVVFSMAGQSLSSFYLLGMELGPWEDYLMQELTPDLAVVEKVRAPRIDWLAGDAEQMLPVFARQLLAENNSRLKRISFTYVSRFDGAFGSALDPGSDLQQIPETGLGLSRKVLSQGFAQQFGENSIISVAALMAHQRYGTSSMGIFSSGDIPGNAGGYWRNAPWAESSYGAGVWMGMESSLADNLALTAGFQSRIDMDSFDSYRGVYSEPGDMDIPARAHLSVKLMASPNQWFTAGVDHVLYSALRTFPSNFLPERFISLLGDSSSPQFNWENLTVFQVGWHWQDPRQATEWWVNLSTRQQPSPTSAVLDSALRKNYSGNVMQVGFSARTGERSKLNLRAAYAPPEYVFGGSVLGVVPDNLDQKLEMEALWIMSF